jgi:hypothetical protein
MPRRMGRRKLLLNKMLPKKVSERPTRPEKVEHSKACQKAFSTWCLFFNEKPFPSRKRIDKVKRDFEMSKKNCPLCRSSI